MTDDGAIGRRTLLCQLAAIGTGVAGCTEDDPDDGANLTPMAVADPTPQPSPADPLELAGWPVAGGRLLEVLRDAMASAPDMPEVVQTAPDDGRRATFGSCLADRLARFEPPSTFLTVAGRELERYERAVHLHPIADLVPADDGAAWPAQVEAAIRIDGEPYAVPMAMRSVNRFCVRTDLLDEAGVDVEVATDMRAFAEALDRIEDATAATGAVFETAGGSLFALLCDCLVDAGGRPALENAAQGDLETATLETAIDGFLAAIDGGRRLVEPGTATDRIGVDDAAVARATPRRIARLENGDRMEDTAVVALPATAEPRRLDVLALPYPKRNPSPAATERALIAVQTPEVAAEIGRVPGLLPADRTGWDRLDGELTTDHLEFVRAADEVVLAPSTGAGIDPNRRWRVLDALERLDATPSAPDVLAALEPVLARG